MMNGVLQMLKGRRSVRNFNHTPIEREKLDAVLEVGSFAPSGMGSQSTVMTAVLNPELIKKLSDMNAAVLGSDSDPFYGAPAVIVVFSDTDRPTYMEDGSLVMGNLMNAAHSVGLDSCWIHRAKEVFETEEGRKLAREWGIPDSYAGIGHCAIGHYAGNYPEAAPRKEGRILIIE